MNAGIAVKVLTIPLRTARQRFPALHIASHT
jgi:hypothetical protein